MRILALALLAAVVAPARSQAQTSFDRAVQATAALELAASRAAPSAPTTFAPAFARDLVVKKKSDKKSTGVTMMIVGGGVILAGALVGGDGGTLLIVGGLVSVGYGYYLYQAQ